jgi:hypothetical protein
MKKKFENSNTGSSKQKSKFEEGDLLIHQQFIRYGINAKEWMCKCILLLPEIERRKIWRKKGFTCIYEYAAKLAGMSRGKVDDALRILKKIEDKPALMKIVKQKGINAIRPVVGISTVETADFWAKKAEIMSKNTLETYVRDIRGGKVAEGELFGKSFLVADSGAGDNFNRSDRRTSTESQPEKVTVLMSLDPEVANELKKLNGKGDWNELMKEFLKMRKEKLEEKKPEPIETESRYMPAKTKQYVTEKTRGICAFPGCCKKAEHFHHADRFTLKKAHDPDHITPLCTNHHSIAHQGLIENEDSDPKFWKVRLEPDRTSPKFWIDRKVLEHRRQTLSLAA